MNSTYFFDTSALVKLYHQETGTEQVEELFRQVESHIVISELATIELYAALARRVRMGEITAQAQEEAIRNFEDDCAQRFVVDPIGNPVIHKAKELLQTHGNTKALRSLDALQLGACLTAQSRGDVVFVCSDVRLEEIARYESLEVLNPEACQESFGDTC